MPNLPSGAVTFLFTDIEGSTRLVKQLRKGYADVLREHQRLIRAAFAAHGGHEIDTQGDSFFIAFGSVREALLAAVDGQLALLSHPWPEGVEVKVRMGLHAGQAVPSENRYTGLAVHRAARIGAAGHGGQILVSQAAQALLEDEEEDLHVFLRDLGEQRLKDFDRPVRLYQVVGDGLTTTFPPLRHESAPAEAAIASPGWRRPLVLAAATLALAGLVGTIAVLATRGTTGGLAEVRPNHVGLIDPETNEVTAEIPVGIRPGPVAAGAGAIWVGNLEDRTLTKLDPERSTVVATISLGNRTPTGVAADAGGVWIAHGLIGQLSRVDPQFGQVTTIPIATSLVRTNHGAVAVGAGAVWAAFGDSTLARVDPADVRVSGSRVSGAGPAAIVVAGGSVWVANAGEATVQRLNASTFEEGAIQTISVGRRPTAIAYGEGAIWVASAGDDAVTRIDPSAGSITPIPVGDSPSAVATGAGDVWVANAADGTVSRIDPRTNEVTRTYEIGNAPSGIAVANGIVWVTVQAP